MRSRSLIYKKELEAMDENNDADKNIDEFTLPDKRLHQSESDDAKSLAFYLLLLSKPEKPRFAIEPIIKQADCYRYNPYWNFSSELTSTEKKKWLRPFRALGGHRSRNCARPNCIAGSGRRKAAGIFNRSTLSSNDNGKFIRLNKSREREHSYIMDMFDSNNAYPRLWSYKDTDQQEHLKCPICDSTNTKFRYSNNHSLSQPRHFCKNCRRYWTEENHPRNNIPIATSASFSFPSHMISPNQSPNFLGEVRIDIPTMNCPSDMNAGQIYQTTHQAWKEHVNQLKQTRRDNNHVTMLSNVTSLVIPQVIAAVLTQNLTDSSSSSSPPGILFLLEVAVVVWLVTPLIRVFVKPGGFSKKYLSRLIIIKIGAIAAVMGTVLSLASILPPFIRRSAGVVLGLLLAVVVATA